MKPAQRSDIPKLYQSAMKLQQKDPRAAFEIYKSILDINPNIAEAYFQMGNIHIARDAYKPALAAYKSAALIKPAEAAIWDRVISAAIALADASEIKLIRKAMRKAGLPKTTLVALDARLTNKKSKTKIVVTAEQKALLDKAIAALGAGNITLASDVTKQAIKVYPDNATFDLIHATAQEHAGNFDTAETHFKAAIHKRKDYAEALKGYGGFLHLRQRHQEALKYLNRAVEIAPKMTIALSLKAQSLAALDKVEEALTATKAALKLDPKGAEVTMGAGVVFERLGRHQEAIPQFKAALKAGMKSPQVYLHLAVCEIEQNNFEDAEAHLKSAEQLDQNFSSVQYRFGVLHQRLGDFDKAEERFRRALELAPTRGEYFTGLAAIKRIKANDPLIETAKINANNPEISKSDRRHFGFSLAKIMEDNDQYDKVFAYLKPANDLMLDEFPYDIHDRHEFIKMLKDAFSDFDIGAHTTSGFSNANPIFVTGMPRSGTTLVEQIIASHSTVEGAGEVGFATDACLATITKTTKSGKTANAISADSLRNLGKDIWEHLKAIKPNAQVISDKSILTYAVLPIIKAALPNSKVIVVRRDPRDNLFSIYKNQFLDGTHSYAYDLKTLGEYYETFDDLIAHWRTQFPDTFYEIQYEDLIADQDSEARKLIAATGLDWEDGCLDFHKNKREVKTLSVYQVRQPIYKSSVKSWQRYETELRPLFEALK